MKFTIQLQIEDTDRLPLSIVLEAIDRPCDVIEDVGLRLHEAKAILGRLQEEVVRNQLARHLEAHRSCRVCDRPRAVKGYHPLQFRTAFGDISLHSPRWHACGLACRANAARSIWACDGGFLDHACRVRKPTMKQSRPAATPAAMLRSRPVLVVLLAFLAATAARSAEPVVSQQNLHPVDSVMTRGEYLAHVGDCVACHSKHGGVPFAGGFAMPTPFGTLYSPNITPDNITGIGKWSAEQFYNMLHTGRSRDGTLLYPAMPFPAYTKITREDSDAIFLYLRTLKPVVKANRENELRFPYNNRSLMFGWHLVFY